MTKELPDELEIDFLEQALCGLNGLHVNQTSLTDDEKKILSTYLNEIEIRGKFYRIVNDQTKTINGANIRTIFYRKI